MTDDPKRLEFEHAPRERILVGLGKAGKIWVSLPMSYARFKDGRNLEIKGYSPKIPLEAGTDALDFVLKRFD